MLLPKMILLVLFSIILGCAYSPLRPVDKKSESAISQPSISRPSIPELSPEKTSISIADVLQAHINNCAAVKKRRNIAYVSADTAQLAAKIDPRVQQFMQTYCHYPATPLFQIEQALDKLKQNNLINNTYNLYFQWLEIHIGQLKQLEERNIAKEIELRKIIEHLTNIETEKTL